MKKEIYAFLERHVDLYNCGQHDLDNSFLLSGYRRTREEIKNMDHSSSGLVDEFASWLSGHWMCTPIGICPENVHKTPGMRYVAMVFEDDSGNRYYTHVPGYWVNEYKAIDQGEEAMARARDEFFSQCENEDYGRSVKLTEKEIEKAAEELSKPENNIWVEPEKKDEDEKSWIQPGTGKRHVYLACNVPDALHNMYRHFVESGDALYAQQIAFIHDTLGDIAKRAAELNDPRLNISMLLMGLYEVDDLYAEVDKMKEKIKETEDQNGQGRQNSIHVPAGQGEMAQSQTDA